MGDLGRKKALSEEQIKEVREIYAKGGIPMWKLGLMYHVSADAICSYVNEDRAKFKKRKTI